jgi:hypothetical protein
MRTVSIAVAMVSGVSLAEEQPNGRSRTDTSRELGLKVSLGRLFWSCRSPRDEPLSAPSVAAVASTAQYRAVPTRSEGNAV